jgi:hemerythrin superfamily protein
MDALRLLRADHKKVDGLFSEVDALGESAHVSRERLFEQIDSALEAHAHVEETIFYPALKNAAKRNAEAKEEVLEAYEEHGNVKAMLEKLKGTDPRDETYIAKLQVLHELIKHHVKEEEHAMFAEAKKLLDEDELEALGEQMEAEKAKFMGSSPKVSKGDIEPDVKRRSSVR